MEDLKKIKENIDAALIALNKSLEADRAESEMRFPHWNEEDQIINATISNSGNSAKLIKHIINLQRIVLNQRSISPKLGGAWPPVYEEMGVIFTKED